MGFGIVIAAPYEDETTESEVTWGPDQQEELGRMAAKFKENGDTVGVHLCAAVEGEMEKHRKGDRTCPCVGRFFLAWAFVRMMADKTGDDGYSAEDLLAHMLLPQIQGLLVEGKRRAMLAKLKAEVADVELDT